jgi:hypothetical protein
MARLDRNPEVKEIARTAACIGREFDFSLLVAIAGQSESNLLVALDRLASAELKLRRGTPPGSHYTSRPGPRRRLSVVAQVPPWECFGTRLI